MSNDGAVIAYCHACGNPMDVTEVGPFTNVECPHCQKHTRVKREFGPYTLMRRQGIGGMSVVFHAHDNTLDREVAVKILNEEYSADRQRIEAFEEEARITASISHPHVVRLFTTGRAFDRYYIAMELVPGGHLECRIRELGQIPETELLPLAIQITEGLKAAHARGLLHRDIKPGNILLDGDGKAKIVDFGLALVTHAGKATAKEIWATPFYVPPETIEGHEEDFRSDLYALGSTLYHALTGTPPCTEETMSTPKLREAKRGVVPLRKAAPKLNAATCAAVDKAMAYSPDDRFASYDELLGALHEALRRVRMSQQRSAQRKAGRGKHFAMAGGIALACILGVAYWAWPRAKPEAPVVERPSVVVPEPDLHTIDPLKLAAIGVRYREGREALAADQFDQALAAFAEVRGAEGVQEPTASWAGVEAVTAAMLAGNDLPAREQAAMTLEHLDRAKLGNEVLKARLIVLLSPLLDSTIPVPELGDARQPPLVVMEPILVGLLHWRRGEFAKAEEAFQSLDSTDKNDNWHSAYAPFAQRYLDDAEELKDVRLDVSPKDLTSCDRELAALAGLLENLKTRGRAAEVIRERQEQLEDARPELEEIAKRPPPPPPQPNLARIQTGLDESFRDSRFEAALRLLGEAKPDEDEAGRYSALVEMATQAQAFLLTLASDLNQSGKLSLTLRDGRVLSNVTVEGASLLGIDASGHELTISWADVSPRTLLKTHQQLVNNSPDEDARMKRHQEAVAFLWLVGEHEVATAAAERIGQQSEEFRQRWIFWMNSLK